MYDNVNEFIENRGNYNYTKDKIGLRHADIFRTN